MAPPTQWVWVWVSSLSWWWTGKPGMLQSMGSQTTELDSWATELNWSLSCSWLWLFLRLPMFLMTLIVLRGSSQIFCRMPLYSHVWYFLMIKPSSEVLGRKITEIKMQLVLHHTSFLLHTYNGHDLCLLIQTLILCGWKSYCQVFIAKLLFIPFSVLYFLERNLSCTQSVWRGKKSLLWGKSIYMNYLKFFHLGDLSLFIYLFI